jgi:predicted HTH transcriptional regulator
MFPVTETDFMALLHIPLDQIDESRLEALITAGAAESRTIDYKRTSYGNTHADYSEFLADTSSFANTSGGDLVLGMDATNGTPTAIRPLTMAIDSEILRLEQVIRGGLQPRIANISFHAVPSRAGGNVLIVRVPRSYNAPHRVIRQAAAGFGHARLLGSMSRTSMNSGRSSMLVPSSRTASATSDSTASQRSPPGKLRFS